jgi:hypothetical protein
LLASLEVASPGYGNDITYRGYYPGYPKKHHLQVQDATFM